MEGSKQGYKKINRTTSYIFIGFFLGVFSWFIYNLDAPLTNYINSLWIILLYSLSWSIIGYFRKFRIIRLTSNDKIIIENLLKKKGFEFEILNPIPIENLTFIIKRLYEELEPNFDIYLSKYPIEYYPQHKRFKIFYNGSMKSKDEIFKILVKKFKTDFTIKSLI